MARNFLLIPNLHDTHYTLYLPTTFMRLFSTHDVYVCNVKIGRLSRSGNIVAARQLFDKMSTKDVVTWNAIITGYWQNGFLQESKKLFESMPAKNIVSWNCMIAGCIELGRVDEAFHYLQSMPKRNTASYNALISGFVNYGRVEDACKFFEEMPRRNVISYTAMIGGYIKNGEIDKARALFDHMPCRNVVSWNVMISGYVENGKFDEAKELFDQLPDNSKNAALITSMIMGYCKQGMIDNAKVLFEGIQCKDRASFNAIISGCAQNGVGEEALRLYSDMHKIGLQPDDATLISVFIACSSLASLKKGRQAHVLVIRNGFEKNVSVCNALVTMYSKCGGIVESELAFRQICSPDLVSWNTVIAAFAQHGLYEKAFSFFSEMGSNGFEPDGITFLSLLFACGHTGKVNESMDVFDLMVKTYGIIPKSEHYACLVDVLNRAGQLEKACQIIQDMPFEADSRIWGSLLAASSVYLNVELGELAAKKIGDLDPHNSGALVMLSNIYAAAGMWREVTRVRILMKEQGVKKQRAYSWTEIGNEVHYFFGGYVSHLDNDEIHLVLKMFCLQMKSADDIADIISSWSSFD
ncbi:hypothetical protein ACOSQ2_023894 [Xanthoceras sorbifolium]